MTLGISTLSSLVVIRTFASLSSNIYLIKLIILSIYTIYPSIAIYPNS